MTEPDARYVEVPVLQETSGLIRYPDLIDALSRSLLTFEEARAVTRRIFGLER